MHFSLPPPGSQLPADRAASLDWNGTDDPLNPHSWSPVRRRFQASTISGFALVGKFVSSVFTLATTPTAAGSYFSATIATLTFSIHQLDLAFCGTFAAPLFERSGRRCVVLISVLIFALFILGYLQPNRSWCEYNFTCTTMRLLHIQGAPLNGVELHLTWQECHGTKSKYAILSHRWRHDEVLFAETNQILDPIKERIEEAGMRCRVTLQCGLEYLWVDACCIDRWIICESSIASFEPGR